MCNIDYMEVLWPDTFWAIGLYIAHLNYEFGKSFGSWRRRLAWFVQDFFLHDGIDRRRGLARRVQGEMGKALERGRRKGNGRGC